MLKTINNEIKNNPRITAKSKIENNKELQITIDQLPKKARQLPQNKGLYRVKAKIESFTFQTAFDGNDISKQVLNEESRQNFKLLEKYFHQALAAAWNTSGEDFLKRINEIVKK